MKTIPAGAFKTNCLAIMDEVKAKRETVVITKHGEPVAKLVPVNTDTDEIFGFFSGKGSVTGDVVSPALSPEEWGKLLYAILMSNSSDSVRRACCDLAGSRTGVDFKECPSGYCRTPRASRWA